MIITKQSFARYWFRVFYLSFWSTA